MKKKKHRLFSRSYTCLCIGVLLLSLLFGSVSLAAENYTGKEADILFLHDTHSHLNSFLTVEDGQAAEVGGFASIKTLINEAREKNPDTLVLDAGDFPWVLWCRPFTIPRPQSCVCSVPSDVR